MDKVWLSRAVVKKGFLDVHLQCWIVFAMQTIPGAIAFVKNYIRQLFAYTEHQSIVLY
jgi:hypothetical protein